MKSHASDVGRGPAVNVLIALVPLAFMTIAAASSRAHEGHDHGAPAVTVTAAAPRVEASSEGFELVGIVNGGAMRVFLDRFASNEPVTSATIDVTVDGVAARAEPQPDGSFLVEAPWLATTGATDVVFAIDTGETSDLLIGTLDLPSAATAAEAAPVSAIGVLLRSPVLWAIGLGLLLAGLALGRALTPRPLRADVPDREAAAPVAQPAPQTSPKLRRRVGAAVLLLLSAAASFPSTARAHGDEDHGPAEHPPASATSPAIAADSSRRLADGSLFVPKPTQRLLTIRTEQVRTGEASRTAAISGRVIADPSAGGRVQAAQGGRIEPPGAGLPAIGQRVVRGQELATVTPVATSLERGGVREQLAQIDSSIAISEQRVARLSQLQGSVPQREIDEARRELDGLRQRRRALGPSLAEREVVRASASGVISVANVVTGQLIEAGAVLFEIVDPAKLWVEAIAYDPAAVVDIRAAV
ncbi:MAG TPA: efflux RND transporter periplasmic adaptor subunit, partial [Rhodospirillales bacterium]|nr:efflux RND transporter periplasmic adaptor subunit [Rhodospirillales bacterium]